MVRKYKKIKHYIDADKFVEEDRERTICGLDMWKVPIVNEISKINEVTCEHCLRKLNIMKRKKKVNKEIPEHIILQIKSDTDAGYIEARRHGNQLLNKVVPNNYKKEEPKWKKTKK